MKAFLAKNKGLHRWLLADGVVLLLFFALRQSRALMNALVFHVTLPLEQLIGKMCSYVPFSVAELCYVLLALDVLACLILAVRYIVRSAHRGEALYRVVLFFADAVLTVYAVFCLLWGANYRAEDFCDRSGIVPREVSCEELVRVTQQFADALAECADTVTRDESGAFTADRAAILAAAPEAYASLYEEFPFLEAQSFPPKPFRLSKILSAMNFTGFYFPFTGEANLNMDSPAAYLPCTALHEMSHQRGYASEQQCNFLAIVGSTRSDDPLFRYSGWLLGYIYLSNALYRADYDKWLAIRDALPDTVRLDIAQNNAYWSQYRGVTARVAQTLNDSMIRSYGDPLGTQSYGAVVDLLVTYYG